jgi:hypothetical protein
MAYTNWLPRSNRAGGEWNSGNFLIPSGINAISIRLNLANVSDFATPDRSITLVLEISKDGAQTWETHMVVGWIGGPPPGKGGGWYASCDGINQLAGFLARVHISQSGTFRYGIQGEIA